MSKISAKKNKAGRIGPILTLATLAFFLVAGIYFVVAQTRESKRLEQALIERYGFANNYTPAIDGSVPPHRVEGFIRVREALQSNCADYQGILDDLIGLDTIETDQEMSPVKKVSEGIGGVTNMLTIAPKFLAFLEVRNRSLLAEEMGLGEYIYIYLAAYGEQLAGESVSSYSGMDEAYISPRARNEFIQILANQLAALEAAGQEASPEGLIADLRGEIEALEDGSHSSPWPNGPAGMTRESLAPYHERLAELYCSGIVEIELQQKNRGLNLRG
jgi:hypothetical protein